MITLYTKPTCVQCDATKRMLDRAGIQYQVVDLTEDDDALHYVQSLGYRQVPVVVAGDQHWSGFQPGKLAALG